MTDEERQRQMDFIVEQQAQFAVNMDLLREAQVRTDATVAQLGTRVDQLTERVDQLTEQVVQVTEQVGRVSGQVGQMATQQTHINEVVAVIADAQQHTDERLSALIDIVQGGLGKKG